MGVDHDRIGDYARDEILAELTAFANAEGGTLVLGLHETTDDPRRAERLDPLPNCEGLARRILDASEDIVEPRLRSIEARALPADKAGNGYDVVLRVGKSAAGPHRLRSTKEFYIRRGERAAKMDVREIKDLTLDLARTGDRIVGFIVTNLSRPADRVVAFYNKRGTCEQWIKEGKGAIKWTRLSCRTFAANAVRLSFMRSLQSWQLSPHACNTGADQGLVADELEGEADQGRREGGEPRTLCRIPNGGGRHPTTNVPGDTAADRGATAAATTRAGMKCSIVTRVQEQSTGGMRPDASENSQISSSTIVRTARAAGSHPHLASVLQQGRKSANIRVSLGVIRGIPGTYERRHLWTKCCLTR
jgi:hypothetical protein